MITFGLLDGTLNVSPTCVSSSKYATEHQYSGAGWRDSKRCPVISPLDINDGLLCDPKI